MEISVCHLASGLLLLLATTFQTPSIAQVQSGRSHKKDPALDQLKVAASFEPSSARPGDTVTLKIMLDPASGFHTYPTKQTDPNASSYQTLVKFPGLTDLTPVGDFEGPDPQHKNEPDLNATIDIYEKNTVMERRFLVSRQATPGQLDVRVGICTLVCNDSSCLPFETELKVQLTVTVAAPEATAREDFAIRQAEPAAGLLSFLFQGIFWGAVSLLTPCVFPMIPITVSFFLKQSEHKHLQTVMQAVLYCATIVAVLTLSAVLLLKFFQDLSQHWATNLALGGLFLVFAFSLFGMYEIRLPSFLLNFTSAREGRGQRVGTVFMALTFTLVSFTCVAPFMGGFAGIAVQQRPFHEIVLGGLAFSATFAAPFFVLAMFPTFLRQLPKSGAWMNTVKVVMGFLELAAALKFLRASELVACSQATYLTYDLVLGMYVTISLLCGLYLLNVFRFPHDYAATEVVGGGRLLFSFFFLSIGFYLIPAQFKIAGGEKQRPSGEVFAWLDSFLLPDPEGPRLRPSAHEASTSGATASELVWTPSLPIGLEQAWQNKRNGKERQLVFVDFTGMSCTNCKKNEKNVFAKPQIQDLMKHYTLVQLFTDSVPACYQPAPDARQNKTFQQQTFGDLRLPLYVILEPLGEDHFKEFGRYDEGLIRNVDAFVDFLRKPLSLTEVSGAAQAGGSGRQAAPPISMGSQRKPKSGPEVATSN